MEQNLYETFAFIGKSVWMPYYLLTADVFLNFSFVLIWIFLFAKYVTVFSVCFKIRAFFDVCIFNQGLFSENMRSVTGSLTTDLCQLPLWWLINVLNITCTFKENIQPDLFLFRKRCHRISLVRKAYTWPIRDIRSLIQKFRSRCQENWSSVSVIYTQLKKRCRVKSINHWRCDPMVLWDAWKRASILRHLHTDYSEKGCLFFKLSWKENILNFKKRNPVTNLPLSSS